MATPTIASHLSLRAEAAHGDTDNRLASVRPYTKKEACNLIPGDILHRALRACRDHRGIRHRLFHSLMEVCGELAHKTGRGPSAREFVSFRPLPSHAPSLQPHAPSLARSHHPSHAATISRTQPPFLTRSHHPLTWCSTRFLSHFCFFFTKRCNATFLRTVTFCIFLHLACTNCIRIQE